MHSYLSAIGFSNIKKEELDNLLYEATKKPDSHEVAFDSEGNEYVELAMQVCDNIGIVLRGTYDEDDNFKIDYYYPYCMGDTLSSTADLDIIKMSDKESYQGLCDEIHLGVNLIFYLQNMMEYLNKSEGRTYFADEFYRNIYLTGLSLGGKILLPVAKTPALKTNQKKIDRNSLIEAARDGDEKAMESLTIDDIDLYSMISKRLAKEDVYSIVTTTFMPYGIESDKYTIIADILEVSSRVNQITLEEMYLLKLESNEIEFEVCVNKNELIGEPAVGRRFKGNVWMQGRVEF